MSLRYEEYGDRSGPLMIFLHGGGVSGWMWEGQIQYFTHYHCVVPILPEHGVSSEVWSETFQIRDTAEKVIQLMKSKGKGKQKIVVGFSLGAQILIEVLSKESHLVDYAMINSALIRPMPLTSFLIGPTLAITYPLMKNRAFAKLQAKELYVPDTYFDRYFQESSQMSRTTLTRVLKENMTFRLPEGFTEAKTSLLITVGEKEKAVMKKSAADLVRSNPNAEGIIVSGVGHGIPLANPPFFNMLLEKWIGNNEISGMAKTLL